MGSDMTKSSNTFGDAIIRPFLRTQILAYQNDSADTVVIEELGICRGQVRVDMAAVNGMIHGYEIKSDRDSLSRLYGQVYLYGKVLDQATLVVGEFHKVEVLDMVPEWWGIISMFDETENPSFYSLRDPKKNPNRDPRSLVELLWRDDALALLEQKNVAQGLRDKTRSVLWDKVCEHYTLDEISTAVRHQLRSRAKKRVYSQPS
jgi:hypothetical protein